MVGAAHAAGTAIDFYRQTGGNLATHAFKFIDGEIDPKAGATSSALGTS